MQDEGFQPACLFQRPYLFTDTADEIEVEVLQHGGNHHEHHVLSHEGKGQVRPSEVVVLYVEVLFARPTFVVERDDVFLGRRPVVGEDAAVCVYHPEHVPPYPAVLFLHGTPLYDEPVRLPFDEVVHADGGDLALLTPHLDAFPFLMPAELLVTAAAVGGTYVERVATLLYGLDDFLRERAAVGTETGYHHAKLRGYAVHDATERVLLMELHVGVSVTVLTPDDDAPDGCPAGEIAEFLLVGIFCVELVGRHKLVVKVQVDTAARLYKVLPLNG